MFCKFNVLYSLDIDFYNDLAAITINAAIMKFKVANRLFLKIEIL